MTAAWRRCLPCLLNFACLCRAGTDRTPEDVIMPPHSRFQLSILLVVVGGLSIVPCAGAKAAVRLPDGRLVAEVDFERHLIGLFGRLGCNSGACHGSFQGKNGFRL